MWRALSVVILLASLAGCAEQQSALHPYGPHAEAIARIFWFFVAVCTTVWVLVMLALAYGTLRRRPLLPAPPDPLLVDPGHERRATLVITGAIAITVLILGVFTTISYVGERSAAHAAATGDALSVKLTGNQWWWNVQYDDPDPSRTLTSANEIHVPVGRPVKVKLAAADVIHSFWVPSLAGKLDLIPGRENEITFIAQRPGVYRGQCAEFCGWQHAHMAVLVIAHAPDEFQAWYDGQLQPASIPADAEGQQGREVFLNKACVLCHTIRGTIAGARLGPDLTHVASRRTIAAGTLPTSRGSFAAWVVDPQTIKPGANMPATQLSPDELNALAAFLDGLK